MYHLKKLIWNQDRARGVRVVKTVVKTMFSHSDPLKQNNLETYSRACQGAMSTGDYIEFNDSSEGLSKLATIFILKTDGHEWPQMTSGLSWLVVSVALKLNDRATSRLKLTGGLNLTQMKG